MTAALLPAVGGTRLVPPPDPVARDYLLLALRLDQHLPGLVDAYVGPADLKATVDMEQLRSGARLRDDAAALRAAVERGVPEPDRRAWLLAQLTALDAHAAGLAGQPFAYADLVERCLGVTPPRHPDDRFDAAAAAIDNLLPGQAALADRLAAWDARFEIPVERLEAVVAWLVSKFRSRAAEAFGLPEGEDLRVGLVSGQPWTAYNWYDGGRRSRVDLNVDLPHRAQPLIRTVAHETYPGHHLEHARKEADLVDEAGRLEASILLINTPECLISEGLAVYGARFVSPPQDEPDLLVELYERAGLAVADDAVAARETAERSIALRAHREVLEAARGNAALLRHADGRSHDEVLAYLRDVGRLPGPRAAKALAFIEHPLWRTYVFAYAEGDALVRRWVEAVPEADQPRRFERLLREQLTPTDLRSTG